MKQIEKQTEKQTEKQIRKRIKKQKMKAEKDKAEERKKRVKLRVTAAALVSRTERVQDVSEKLVQSGDIAGIESRSPAARPHKHTSPTVDDRPKLISVRGPSRPKGEEKYCNRCKRHGHDTTHCHRLKAERKKQYLAAQAEHTGVCEDCGAMGHAASGCKKELANIEAKQRRRAERMAAALRNMEREREEAEQVSRNLEDDRAKSEAKEDVVFQEESQQQIANANNNELFEPGEHFYIRRFKDRVKAVERNV